MNATLALCMVVLAIVGIGIPLAWWIHRQNYVKSIEARGWRWTGSPTWECVRGLNVPPFGLGYRRRVDDLVEGTTTRGVPFRVVEYSSSATGKDRYALLALTGVHDPAYIARTGLFRVGAGGYNMGQVGGLSVYTSDPADTGLLPAIAGVVPQQLGTAPVNLSIDGRWLVAAGCPEPAEEMAAFVEALAPVALAINTRPTSTTWIEPQEYAFHGRPDMFYRERDDSFLDRVGHTTGGFNHEAHDVLFSDNFGLPVIALTHTWQTTRTETYTDSDGKLKTRSVTDNHSEGLCEVEMPCPFVPIEVRDQGIFGPSHKVQFESIDFDQRYEVGCPNPKFASDVFHPRMLEWLLQVQPPAFRIRDGRFGFNASAGSAESVMYCADFAHQFLSRVPAFVWKDLGIAPPTFRQIG